MNKSFKMLLAACLLLVSSLTASAKVFYGFRTGGTDEGGGVIGIAKFDSDANELTIVESQMFQFWGGAFAGDKYYYLLSDDANGYMFEGLCTFDFATNTSKVPFQYQEYGCSDMTYDYTTSTLYGVMTLNGGMATTPTLVSIDLTTGKKTKIAELTEPVKSIACNYYGDMYAMTGNDAQLYKLDQTTGALTLVGPAGIEVLTSEVQSMDFDRQSGELYWSALDSEEDAFIARVDLTTGTASERMALPNGSLLGGLHVPFVIANDDAPEKPQALKASAEQGGVVLSWTNPTKTYKGEDLTEPLTKIEITRDGTLLHVIENPDKGAALSWTDALSDQTGGVLKYVVYAYNASGRSEGAMTTVVAGDDVPTPVTDVALTSDGANGLLTWKAPAAGKNGGMLDAEKLSYRITRQPDNVQLATTTGTSFTDNSISTTAYYHYDIVAVNNAGESDAAVSPTAVLGAEVAAPWTADFSSALGAAQWLVADNNADNFTWKYKDGLYEYPMSFGETGDDDLTSIPVSLVGGKEYKATYHVAAPGFVGEVAAMRLTMSDGKATTTLDELSGYSTSNDGEDRTVTFTPEQTGQYAFTFTALSEAWQWVLQLSAFSVEENVKTGLTSTEKAETVLSESLCDLSGKVLRKVEGAAMSLQGVPAGAYVVKTQTANGLVVKKVLVK